MIQSILKHDQPAILNSIELGYEMPLRENWADEQDFLTVLTVCIGDDSTNIIGGVVLLNTPFDVPFLSKIWVHPNLRKRGIATELWNHVERKFPRFFWRSMADNPVVPFYKTRAKGGHIPLGQRFVYFNDLWPQDKAGSPLDAVTWAYNLPFDFIRSEAQAA